VISNSNVKSNSQCGIYQSTCPSTQISGNNVSSNAKMGIVAYTCNGISVTTNDIWLNGAMGYNAVEIRGSTGGSIVANNIGGSLRGLSLVTCTGLVIYHNDFVNNANRVYDSNGPSNSWDSGGSGNYYSDYGGSGYYYFNYQGVDHYPLLTRWP